MHRTLHGIVLGTTRHSDRAEIINLYTAEYGRMSLVSPASGSGKAGRMRRAILMPLSLIEAEVDMRPDRELQRLGRISLSRPNHGIIGNPLKSAIALFICDFLSRLLRESPADQSVWEYIAASISILDNMANPANYHIVFLSRLTALLGIWPDVTAFTPHSIFDLREGTYSPFYPPHNDVLRGEENRWPLLLSKLSYSNCQRFRMSRATRQRVLSGILTYYSIHNSGTDFSKSVDVLRALFD